MNKRIEIGEVGVDAGLIFISDPCYCVTPDASEHPAQTWDDFCDQLREKEKLREAEGLPGTAQWNYRMGHPGLGVSVESGYGDGVYPVYATYTEDGRIAKVEVIFIEEEEADENL